MMIAFLLLSVLSSSALSAYLPGTPGAAWTKAEVLAVKAKLWLSFVQRGFLVKQARVNILLKYLLIICLGDTNIFSEDTLKLDNF